MMRWYFYQDETWSNAGDEKKSIWLADDVWESLMEKVWGWRNDHICIEYSEAQ